MMRILLGEFPRKRPPRHCRSEPPGPAPRPERADGGTQVTYDGRPLYYYAHEGKNVVECHNIREFGGLWLAVTPSGKPAD